MSSASTAAIVFVAAVILAAAPILYFGAPTQSVTTSSTSTSTGSTSGLQLRLALSSTAVAPSDRLQLSVQEYNTLPSINNVSRSNLWGVGGLSLGECGHEIYPFGVMVTRGWYALGNISQAQPLRIYPLVACPMLIRLVTGYVFEPNSHMAVILPSSGNALPTPMVANVTVSGEYNGTALLPLERGAYTVVAGDEWGSLAVLHFTVGGHSSGGVGYLDASIDIGPTQPVCRANATVGPAPEPYASIEAVVSSASGRNVTLPVAWVSNGCSVSGEARTSLQPGTYELSLSSCQFMGCRFALPKSFTISSGQTTDVAVSIDTGIR